MLKPTVVVLGASKNPAKHSNKAVRAYLKKGYEVYPVNPNETTIEGLKVYPSISDIPVEIDRVTIYLPPQVVLQMLDEIAPKKPRELFLNPGSESPEVLEKAKALGLAPILGCSITDIGINPTLL